MSKKIIAPGIPEKRKEELRKESEARKAKSEAQKARKEAREKAKQEKLEREMKHAKTKAAVLQKRGKIKAKIGQIKYKAQKRKEAQKITKAAETPKTSLRPMTSADYVAQAMKTPTSQDYVAAAAAGRTLPEPSYAKKPSAQRPAPRPALPKDVYAKLSPVKKFMYNISQYLEKRKLKEDINLMKQINLQEADVHPSGTGMGVHPKNMHTVRDPNTKQAYASFSGPKAYKEAAAFAKKTGGEHVPPQMKEERINEIFGIKKKLERPTGYKAAGIDPATTLKPPKVYPRAAKKDEYEPPQVRNEERIQQIKERLLNR